MDIWSSHLVQVFRAVPNLIRLHQSSRYQCHAMLAAMPPNLVQLRLIDHLYTFPDPGPTWCEMMNSVEDLATLPLLTFLEFSPTLNDMLDCSEPYILAAHLSALTNLQVVCQEREAQTGRTLELFCAGADALEAAYEAERLLSAPLAASDVSDGVSPQPQRRPMKWYRLACRL